MLSSTFDHDIRHLDLANKIDRSYNNVSRYVIVNMENLITAGQLARLASTTKRTILFYAEIGILTPARVGQNGYRYYDQRQILDYQMILFLTSVGVRLTEIKTYLSRQGTLRTLFSSKKKFLEHQLRLQTFSLDLLAEKLKNLEENGTMVKAHEKTVSPFRIYFVERTGPYVMIEKYGDELKAMLKGNRAKMVPLTIFEDIGYRPRLSHMKVGVMASSGIEVQKKYVGIVHMLEFDPGTIVSYIHRGAFETLSLSWKELEKWTTARAYKPRTDIPDYEIYHPNSDVTKQYSDICLPVIPPTQRQIS